MNGEQVEPEASLVAEVIEAFNSRGFAVRHEVRFLVTTADGQPQERRVEMLVRPPAAWEHARRFPALAVEAKRRGGGDMGAEVDGYFQVRSVVAGRRFQQWGGDEAHLVRPGIALYVDRESWTYRRDVDTRESMLMARILWRDGCAVLRRNYRGDPCFLFAGAGDPQRTYTCVLA